VIHELQEDSLQKAAALKDARAELKAVKQAAASGSEEQELAAEALAKELAEATKQAEKTQVTLQLKIEKLKKAEERNKVLREQKQKVNAKVKDVQERNRKLAADNKSLREENREVKRAAKDRLAAELQALGVELKAVEERERQSRESFAVAEAELAAEAGRAEELQARMQEQAGELAALRQEKGEAAGPTGPSLPNTPMAHPEAAADAGEQGASEKQASV